MSRGAITLADLKNPQYKRFDAEGHVLVNLTPNEAAELALAGWTPEIDACLDKTCHICEGNGIVIMQPPSA